MARPPKTAAVIKMEGKSHRTKKELAIREKAEKGLLTGKMMIETADVRNDKVAHLEYLRLKPLLKAIEKYDEIYGAGVRRYCLTKSKLEAAEKEVIDLKNELEQLKDSRETFIEAGDIAEYYRLITKMGDTITKREQVAKSLRAEMIDFEKEYCMTIKSALRAIPKKPETKANALKETLGV